MANQTGEAEYRAVLLGPLRSSSAIVGPRPENASVRKLVGFAVSALLDLSDRSRAEWADELEVSRSHLSRMTNDPTGSFISRIDLALADTAVLDDDPSLREMHLGQRLKPRLADYYGEVRPDEKIPQQSVVQWLARQCRPTTPEDLVAHYLLRSEVALERAQMMADARDLEGDKFIGGALNDLLTIASSPYGGSTVAMQRVVELGLFAPNQFFNGLAAHIDRSPVAFRLLRVIDRFMQVWRARGRRLPATRNAAIVEDGLRFVLRKLLQTPIGASDPYPGAEWSTTLAYDRLGEQIGTTAARWLKSTALDEQRSDRERLYAAWVWLAFGWPHRDVVIDSLRSSDSDWVARWGDVFHDCYRIYGECTWQQMINRSQSEFREERNAISAAVRLQSAVPPGIAGALESIVTAALYTPDGQLRRHLIEGVVTAGLVEPTLQVLVDLYRAESNQGARESILFFVSRLRQPSSCDLLLHAAKDRKAAYVRHTALWGLGDVYEHSWSDEVLATCLDVLENAGSGQANGNPIQQGRERVAAAHALLVIGARELVSTSGAERDNEARQVSRVEARKDRVRSAIRRVHDAQGSTGPEQLAQGLTGWALAVEQCRGSAIADPTRLSSLHALR